LADDDDDDDLEFEPADAGVAFRAEMAATNFFMGYWRHIVAVLVLVLLGFLGYGQYDTWYQGDQRETSRSIFEAEKRVLMAEEEPPPEVFTELADELVAIAELGRGTARIEALLKSAEYYRVAGNTAKQRSSLEAVAESGPSVTGFTAKAALANLDLDAGDSDSAVARLLALMEASEGSLAQQAALDLALMYEHLGRVDEARSLYAEFPARYPDSVYNEQVSARLTKLGGAG
jgi:hypothetical protein